jgi:hemerythrin superfamily protein
MLLSQISHALAKHAIEEENVIYAALRIHNQVAEADRLNSDHGYVKQYLFELGNMETDHPQFMAKIRDFRAMLETHMREEEEKVFPKLRGLLSKEESAKLTKAMNQEGLKIA